MGDEPVMATNDDASECKRGAVQLGYWSDPYIGYFVRHVEKRAPEIHRGYYARVRAVEGFVRKFCAKAGPRPQIVNLGAGFDTLYWRLKDHGLSVGQYVEVDYPAVSSKKCHAIRRSKTLLERVHQQDGEVKISATDMHANNFHLLGADLRNIPQLESKFKAAELDFSRPTLFIAECVLVYIELECVNRLLSWLAKTFQKALFLNYEMCNIGDTFGAVMSTNLRERGCSLAGAEACKSLETQKNRFMDMGWRGAQAWDMVQLYHSLPAADRIRIEAIEFLDEQELLIQLFQHYCVCLAWTGDDQFADIDCTGWG